jgi:hypothetical protein
MKNCQPALAGMELNGIHFDQATHADLVKRGLQKKEPIKVELMTLLN